MKSGMQIDTSQFNRAMRQFSVTSRKDVEKVARGEMRLLVQRLAELTPPAHGRGSGTAAKKLGEGAVRRDINRVFFPVKGKVSIITGYHQRARNNRGRVPRGTAKNPANYRLIENYIKVIQKHVGKAKAGWLAAVAAMKSPGIPAWVRRHGTSDGGFVDHIRNGSGYIEASNRNKAIGGLNQEARILDAAFKGRLRDLRRKTELVLESNARKISARRAA